MSVVFGLSLVTNESVRGYQLQILADANYPIDMMEDQIKNALKKGDNHIIFSMGTVIDVTHFKRLHTEIELLERVGFKPVGKGSEYYPAMILDEKKLDLEGER